MGLPLDADDLRRIRHALRARLRSRNFSEALIGRCLEDAIGQSVVELSEAVKVGKQVPEPIAWVVKVAIWRSIDRLRREEREAPIQLSAEVVSEVLDRRAASTDEQLEHAEAARLRRAIDSLPEDQRQALLAYYFRDLSTRKAASLLNWHERTFRRRLKAATETLRDQSGVAND
jgi:RNA polymerase sigma factor (sigma-70 family)